MKTTLIILSMILLSSDFAIASGNIPPDKDEQQIFIGEGIAEADTEYGRIRGFLCRGIYTFLGVPYGADTGGKNRFMPPQSPEKWEGVRAAVAYGASCPQDFYDRNPESYSMFVDHWNYDVMSEDCLRLNIWTPDNSATEKRPVLVWLHGGGFTKGNGIEQDSYNGENISRYGNIVYCSLNHRLGALGFCDLSSVDSVKYADSANVGMLDIIAALKWIKNNISNFGGDPDNVTIMGQSGGGSKVCMLCAMPAAKGLFHKAVALSGNATRANDNAYSRKLGEAVLDNAGLTVDRCDSLQTMPVEEFMKIAKRAEKAMARENPGYRSGFAPAADGVNIPKGELFGEANGTLGPDMPMLLCSTYHEWNPNRDHPEFESLTLPEVAEKIEWQHGANALEIVEAYRAAFPECRPIEIWAMIASNRVNIVKTADAVSQKKSPVYMAWFGWKSPLFNGRHRAFHCLDISFWMLNTDLMITHTGGGIVPRRLSIRMADALLSFMRTGNPNCSSLPTWLPYTSDAGEVMILDNECRMANDPDRIPRQLLTR